jgi:hypothetical protein
MIVLAFLTERASVKKVLEHLGLPTTGPPIANLRMRARRGSTSRVIRCGGGLATRVPDAAHRALFQSDQGARLHEGDPR